MRAWARFVSSSVLLGLTAVVVPLSSGCNRANPLYVGHDAAVPSGAAGSGPGAAGSQGAAGDQGAAGATDGAAATSGADGGGADATLGACKVPGDCLAARGAPACGQWQCRAGLCAVVCPACVDVDNDGFGAGNGCAGPDCDDNDPTITDTGTRACYDGKGGTLGVGACRAGRQACSAGVWSPCGGQVLPAAEACNGVDDDCNGKADDGLPAMISCGLGACAQTVAACANGVLGVCKPGTPAVADTCGDGKDNDCNGVVDETCDGFCVHVAPNGDDQQATGTVLRPFRSIQAAIDYAAGAATRPKNVCVAGGAFCGAANPTVYQAPDGNPLVMANGVSVYGNYETTTWSRCSFGAQGLPNLNVTIAPRSITGVTFGATVTSPTTLDGVRIARFGGGGGAGNNTTAGITVSGAKQVQISNVVIDDAQNTMISYGVNLINGGEALITRSAIFGGNGAVSSAGVHSAGAKPTIRDNCATPDPATGHCAATCGPTSLGLHGRSSGGGGGPGLDNGGAEAVAIDLADSPGAIVERNAVCGTLSVTGVGVRIAGAAAGTVVRGNTITADAATSVGFGVSLLACGDASPWIVDNEAIVGDTTGPSMRAAGVNAVGACHPVIDGNTRISSGVGGTPMAAFGVFCGAEAAGAAGAAPTASRCVVAGNKLVQGSPSVHPAQTFAVACDAGCARVSGNTLAGGNGGTVVGLSLHATSAFVERNTITGGCGSKTTTAVLAEDASSLVENNVVRGGACNGPAFTPEADGVRVHVAVAGNEVTVGSNTIDAGGAGQCQGVAAGIGLGNGAGPKSPRGIFRDNILRAGACALAHIDFIETEAGVTPRLFQNNDLDPGASASTLYLRPANSPAGIGAVNALPGASGNISADPMFVGLNDLHLVAGSPCVNAGTPAGAPKVDFDGKARDDRPDIGAFER